MCFPYIIKRILWQKHGYNLSIVSFCLLYLFVWPVSLWVLVLLLFLGCKDLWNNANNLAKWYGHVMRCLELRSRCVSLKIIAHLRTFVNQSDSSIQQPHSINIYYAHYLSKFVVGKINVFDFLQFIKAAFIWSKVLKNINIVTSQYKLIFFILIYLFLMAKLNFQQQFFQFSVSHDPSKSILKCWFGAQVTFLIIIIW